MGISALIGAISLVGFLLFLVGIGQAVVSASQGRSVRTGVMLSIIGLVVGLLFSVIRQRHHRRQAAGARRRLQYHPTVI